MKSLGTLSALSFMVALLIASGCSPNEEETPSQDGQQVFTKQQKMLADVQTGRLEQRVLSPVVVATGEVEVPPQGMASVSVPLGGYLVKTELVPGDYVRKGQMLAELSNPEYITLQQSWLETSGELKFASQDFERQKTLQAHDATATRRLQESEAHYSVLKARLAGLREQLRLIGIDLNRLNEGKIQPVVTLRAPVSGYVTRVNHHPGQFVEPREVVFEIVNPINLHLHLNVFERDISRVEIGQHVRFKLTGSEAKVFDGAVVLVSPKRNSEMRTFDVHVDVTGDEKGLKPGMYVEAEIFLSRDSVSAVPLSAVVSFENKTYVLVEADGHYRQLPVETGVRMSEWVEILNADALKDKDIVISGAPRLFNALQTAGE